MRKICIALMVFLFAGACVLGAGALLDPEVSAPKAITAASSCPVTGCANGSCHGFENVPDPDGLVEMVCPEAGCSSVECHAWDTLSDRYHRASDASLNMWILAPVVLVIGLVMLVRKAR